MRLPSLDQFLESAMNGGMPKNAYVRRAGFTDLYVRVTKRVIEEQAQDVIDIARVDVKNPGRGTFTRLIEHLRKTYPKYGIFVESVFEDRFADTLKYRFGFKKRPDEPSYYWLP